MGVKGEKGRRGEGEKGRRGEGEKGRRGEGEKGRRGKGKGERGKGKGEVKGKVGLWVQGAGRVMRRNRVPRRREARHRPLMMPIHMPLGPSSKWKVRNQPLARPTAQ